MHKTQQYSVIQPEPPWAPSLEANQLDLTEIGGKELRAGDESATALNADISYLSTQVSLPVRRLWGCLRIWLPSNDFHRERKAQGFVLFPEENAIYE